MKERKKQSKTNKMQTQALGGRNKTEKMAE
jgi:hypothetical protein